MKYIFSIALLLFTLQSFSQDCSNEEMVSKKGRWKEGMKGSQGGTAAELAKEKQVIASIHNMIKSKYSPMGVEAIYHGAYNPAYPGTPANGFSYGIIPLNFYCDGNTVKTAHETSTYFSINANYLDAEIYEMPDIKTESSGMGFHYISDMPLEKDGYWYFEEKEVGLGLGIKGKSKAWLVTYEGKLPFAFVSKKEFLGARKIILTNSMNETASGYSDVLKRIEIEKKFKETEYRNEPEKWSRYLKMDYTDTKARYEKLIADNGKNYEAAFKKIETMLNTQVNTLNDPAIVKQDPNDHLSYLFTDDQDPFGKILIKPNPGYFNKKIPRSFPQFFLVNIRGNDREPIAARAMRDIIKAVDFEGLKKMLGK